MGGAGKIDLYVGKEVVRRAIPMEGACDELIELIKVLPWPCSSSGACCTGKLHECMLYQALVAPHLPCGPALCVAGPRGTLTRITCREEFVKYEVTRGWGDSIIRRG